MKFFSLCFFTACCSSLSGQQLMWFDTLDYNASVSVGDIKAVSSDRLVMFGGQGVPDRYNPTGSLYVTTLDASGKRIWYRDDIIGGGDRSNLHCDAEGNIYFAQRFFDTTSSICGTPVNPGTYMICLNKNGAYKWHTPMPISPSSPNTVVTNQKGLIELRSGIGGGKVALHQYDAQGTLVHTDLKEQSRFCKYDNQGNAYKIINGLYTKFNADGHPEWIYQVGPYFDNIVVDPNGYSYLIADSYGFNCDVVCLNPEGKTAWTVSLPTTNAKGDCDGSNLYLAGIYGTGTPQTSTETQGGAIYKIDLKSGEVIWQTEIPHSRYFKVMALSAAGGNIYVGAHFQNSTTYAYLLMIKDNNFQPVVTTGVGTEKAVGQFGIFPNPGSEVFTITVPENCTEYSFQVLDASGKVVRQVTGCSGNQEINLEPNAKGIYQVRIQPENGPAQVKKIIVE